MPRFVQIVVTGHANTSETQANWTALALDVDGTVWLRSNNHAAWQVWQEYPANGGRS